MTNPSLPHIYGPLPSRRLGRSLGISVVPRKTCNFSCIYCMLGNTTHLTNTRERFAPVTSILEEFQLFLKSGIAFDTVTICGEGEPTLVLGLGELIRGLKAWTDKPVAVITNGALLYDAEVQNELMAADIILPTLSAVDEASFKTIYRPHKDLDYTRILQGLIDFPHMYPGQLWLEIMLMRDLNDNEADIAAMSVLVQKIRTDKIHLNTPNRPPAEADLKPVREERLKEIARQLGATIIQASPEPLFKSAESDNLEAVLSLISRHPMATGEIRDFLRNRGQDPAVVLNRIRNHPGVESVFFQRKRVYRLNNKNKP